MRVGQVLVSQRKQYIYSFVQQIFIEHVLYMVPTLDAVVNKTLFLLEYYIIVERDRQQT